MLQANIALIEFSLPGKFQHQIKDTSKLFISVFRNIEITIMEFPLSGKPHYPAQGFKGSIYIILKVSDVAMLTVKTYNHYMAILPSTMKLS